MGTRVTVMGVIAVLHGTARADEQRTTVTLEPTKLTFAVASHWQVLTDRAGDFLHDESDDARTIDISFERTAESCRKWRGAPDTRKEFPAYWPKKARTHLYTHKVDGKQHGSGCLADTTAGALIAHVEITVTDAKWRPSKTDVALVRDALTAAQIAATTKPAEPAPEPPPTITASPQATVQGGVGAPIATASTELKPNAHRGGTVATLPKLELAVKLPKGAIWIVGNRGEMKIERDDPNAASLAVSIFETAFRTCNEWRVDASATDVTKYSAHAGYLPASAKHGAFSLATVFNNSLSTCIETKHGPLQLAIDYAHKSGTHDLAGADALLTRALVEAIVKGANQQRKPLYIGTAPLDGGTHATSSVGKLALPTGAQWRVSGETIERFDRGRYFVLSLHSRPSCAIDGTAQPFLPASAKATVTTRSWGTTVVKTCLTTTRSIEATLVYDGKIAESDHGLIRALFEAVLATTKSATKS